MEEVQTSLSKCGGLIESEGKAYVSLKQLVIALRSRLNDSQSNLKPLAATVIGSLLNHVNDGAQAKLGKVVFPALANAAMNDMKKTMRDAAVSALSMGTERPTQSGGGINLSAIECFIACLESELSDAALKSSGLADVLEFLTVRLEPERQTGISTVKLLATVIVKSLTSPKAGSRSAGEQLLKLCTSSGMVPPEALDKEIGKLLPAQQRGVRSYIPKLSAQEKELVETFKRPQSRAKQPSRQPSARPSSARLPSRQDSTTRSSKTSAPASATRAPRQEMRHGNPLYPTSTHKSTKIQRLAYLGRNDHWPDYPEEPSDSAIQSLRKSWSSMLSPTSAKLLFPKGGIQNHEDALNGIEVIEKAIEYSKADGDDSFLEQLDFILKWTACALLTRDHTSGLRSLLAMIHQLFERLHNLSIIMEDNEAIIVLPYILEKASVAKTQFKGQFDNILSFLKSTELYPLKRYGPHICMRVVEKSKSSRAQALAATEAIVCVSSLGVAGIGKKGVIALSRTLSSEKVTEIRMAYLDLFDTVVQKYGNIEKLFVIIGDDNLPDKTKKMILDRCSKRPATAPAGGQPVRISEESNQSRLRTPSRKSVSSRSVSPRANTSARDRPSSSAAAIPSSRLQSNKAIEGTAPRLPPTTAPSMRNVMPPRQPPGEDDVNLYVNTMRDIRSMIDRAGSINDAWMTTVLGSIRVLSLAFKQDASDATTVLLKGGISSDRDGFIETLMK